ncbi:glycosyltransferase [bacterium]|jgi:glycosyltransferase involved in cell wall biosynthesis|nr:glycosyltransferase [bacterium]
MPKKDILFLLSHQPNPRFVKQIKFLSQNNNVSIVYYYRDYMKDLSCEYKNNVVLNKSLGTISNGNYTKRIGSYVKSFGALRDILKMKSFDVLLVNNIDTLALFKVSSLFLKIDTKNIIEISDLRSHTYTNGLKSMIMRNIEKLMFKYVDKLIVTSPKFYDMYYHKLFKGKYFLLENKPLSNMIPKKLEKVKNDKVIIGIVGLLLQGKPYKTLFEAVKNNDKYEVHIYGKGVYQNLVEEYSNQYENIKYFGEYNFFQDSAKIYSTLDILYMPYDTTNGSLNNKIALPNKLYEAMYFQVPIITSSGTYLGELVEKYNIGLTVECCDDNLIYNIEKIINSDICINLDENVYLADDDYIEMEEYVLSFNK